MPGRSFVPLLDGRTDHTREYAFLQWDDYGFGVVSQRYKLCWWDCDSDGELYDLQADPLEKVNLYRNSAYATMRDELLSILNAWREKGVGSPA